MAASCTLMTPTVVCFHAHCGPASCCGHGNGSGLGRCFRQRSGVHVWAGPDPAGWNGRQLELALWSLGSGSCGGVSQSAD